VGVCHLGSRGSVFIYMFVFMYIRWVVCAYVYKLHKCVDNFRVCG
jgi:hypothetical protein